MAAVTSAVLGAAGLAASMYGAKQQADATKDAARAARGVQFSPYSFYGPGGMFAGVGTATPNAPAPGASEGMVYAGGSPGAYAPGGSVYTPPTGAGAAGGAAPIDPMAFLGNKQMKRYTRAAATDPNVDPASFLGNKAQQQYMSAQDSAFRGARDPLNINGMSFDPASGKGQDIMASLGDLDPARQAFLSNLFAAQGSRELPDYVFDAAGTAAGALNPLGVNPMAPNAGMGQYDRDLEEQLRGTGMSALDIARMDPMALGQQRYDLLSQQAAPGEQRAFNRLNDSMFSTGRLGTTGGGIQTEAFARGIAEADLGRQVQGMDFGRQVQSDAMQRALGGFGQRDATRTMEDMLNQNAFGRTQQGYQNFFGNALQAGQYDQNAAMQRFNLANNMFNLSRNARTGSTEEMMQNLGGIQALQGMSMEQLQAALQFGTARSNAATGQASAMGNIASQTNPWLSLGTGALGGVLSQPGGMFGGMGGNNMSGLSPIEITAQRMPVPGA